MPKKVDVAIIGAGSAGLAALRQVAAKTDNFLLVDPGPLGTTCARVGCMPSKVLIETARHYHGRHLLAESGIGGNEHLFCDLPAVLRHVRRLRDHFAAGMVDVTRRLAGPRLLEGRATLLGPNRIAVKNETIECATIILAVGSRPTIPETWRAFGNRILTTDTLFEQQDLPRRLALIGLGINGLELGQALSRLGIEVTGFGRNPHIGGIRDPDINRAALDILRREFPLHVEAEAEIASTTDALLVRNGSHEIEVDACLAAIGATPNILQLGLESLNIETDRRGMPVFNPHSMQVGELPIFIAGDANGYLPLLHEAQDEGFIAGRNACDEKIHGFRRRTPLTICFTDPQIAALGTRFDNLDKDKVVTGRTDFSEQSRAVIERRNAGRLHIYVEKSTARVLGAEMIAPDAEHLAQLLALAVQQNLTVHEALMMPFYHPTIEEGLRSALRDAARQLTELHPPAELALCDSCLERPLS